MADAGSGTDADAKAVRPTPAIRDAATVMLVRDDPDGRLEVFMLRRNLNSDFVGGAYVFPGGAVDPADAGAEVDALCDGRDDAACSALLDLPAGRGGLAFWVAAVRECFEEAGVLLAHTPGGQVVSFAEPEVAERFEALRRAVYKGETRLVEICADEGLVLSTGSISYFSHWITPEGPPRRYDTRFFVAAAPPEQVPLEDGSETVANLWVRPLEALAAHERGELDLIFPTIRNLQAIGRFASAADLLAHAAAIEHVPAIMPRIVADEGGGLRILIPGDPGYDEAAANGVLPLAGPLPGRAGGPAMSTGVEPAP